MKTSFYLVTSLCLFICTNTYSQSFVSLGSGSNCDFNTLQSATLQAVLNTSPDEIRLVNNVSYIGQFNSVSSVKIRGGFDSCIDANNNTQSTTRSVIDGNFQGTTYTVNTSGVYEFENISIANGLSTLDGGGLLLSAGDMVVNLDRVMIINNEASGSGGGIYKGNTGNVLLTILDSIVINNVATFGGGIGFTNDGELILYGDTEITQNEATTGGGVLLLQTKATFVVGTNPPISSGIILNKSTRSGGGLYASFSDVTISGGLLNVVGLGTVGASGSNYIISSNIADFDNNNIGSGGGIYLTNSNAVLNAVSVVSNFSNWTAAGISVEGSSTLSVGIPDNSECQQSNEMGCNLFEFNQASRLAGAVYVGTGSNVNFTSSNFNNNRANFGTAFMIEGSQANVNISASLLYNNGDLGANGYNDFSVFHIQSNGTLNIEQITAINNKTINSFIYNDASNLNSYNSYFFNGQTGPWLNSNGIINEMINCLIVDDINNTASGRDNISLTSLFSNNLLNFVDSQNHNYHITNTSPLLDFVGDNCFNSNTTNTVDIDGQIRTLLFDIGADENLIHGIVFKDSFE